MTRNPAGAAPARAAPRPRGPLARAVGSYVPKLTQKAFEKYGFSAATLLTDWATIVGTELASFTAPERLKWPRGVEAYGEVADGAQGRPGATLILRVDGPRALEIEHRGRQILERINAYFGYRAVSEMRIVQAPIIRRDARPTKPTAGTARPVAPRSGPAVDLQGIPDEKLRAALATLEASIASDRRR
ncbi:MAG: DUF721 domain-containing protein [Hyphomicrobiaceae bacterium]